MTELQNAPKAVIKNPSSDRLALRGLVAELNNPLITGAVVPPEEKASIDAILATPMPEGNVSTPGPSLTPTKAAITKVFLTGRAGGPEQLAGVSGVSLRHLVEQKMEADFGFRPTPSLVAEYQAWASGRIDASFPRTLTRALLESLIKRKEPNFGTEGYLLGLAQERVNEISKSGKLAIITGVDSIAGFKLLQKNGYTHFHVMMSNTTASQRPQQSNDLSNTLDNDVIKKISFQKDGGRLHVVWLDNQPSPSSRFYSLQDFQREISVAEMGQEIGIS